MFARFLLIIACIVVLGSPGQAWAVITGGSASPAAKTLSADRSATVRVIWNLRTIGGTSATVETDDGEFLINGVQQDVNPQLPTQTKNSGVAVNSFSFTFTETVNIPLNLIQSAIAQGKPLVYSRAFSATSFMNDNVPLSVTFNFAGGIGGPLEISRLRLSFDNGASTCTAKAGEDVSVTAYIDTEGSGSLRGNWQVREHGTGSNFRTIRTAQIPIQGGRNIEIKSPPLPTDGSGRLDIRFDVTNPAISFNEPFVTCMISGTEAPMVAHHPVGTRADVTSPQDFMPVNNETRITWKPVEGAVAYRIELYATADGEPVAAQQVKGNTLDSTLSPLVLEKLNPKRRYMVRVYAE